MISLDEIFSAEGPFNAARGSFETRPGQVAMAKLIERGFLESTHTLVEAGTGVGKSFGYLVPALRSGKRVVISTGTIALQEQLVTKDIPAVCSALGISPTVVLLKGRSNYLCIDKYERSTRGALFAPTKTLNALWDWGAHTSQGDRAELDFMPPSYEWETLDADADECVGELCSHFRDCFYFRKRDAARDAQIIVVNHALFFRDLVAGNIIPPYDFAILDEAHQCERAATDALTGVVSERTLGRLMRRIRSVYRVPHGVENAVEQSISALQQTIAVAPSDRYSLRPTDALTRTTDERLGTLYDAMRGYENWVEQNGLTDFRRKTEGEEASRRREFALRTIGAALATIERARAPGEQTITWIERQEAASAVHTAPFEVADVLRERLFYRVPSVVLTSATIAENGSFAFLRRTLGVERAEEFVAPSPFRYEQQARLYLAPAWLNPKARDFVERAVPIVEEILDRTRGRAFILFTSIGRMHMMRESLRGRLTFPTRMQGEMPRAALLDWFRTTKNAVLFGTGTFWEGIDVVGDALSCVVIDRLPFPSPGDPLVAARVAALEANGENGFEGYMVPAAIVRLKQGFGRLIRSESDRGVLVLLDGRAGSTEFGRTIIRALPPAKRVHSVAELAD